MKNSKIICTFMMKGGVGKTTVTANLAFELSKYGKTLMIDVDQQGHLSYYYIKNEIQQKNLSSILDVLKGTAEFKDSIIEVRKESENYKGLYLLGVKTGDNLLKNYFESDFRDNPYEFERIISEANENDFDYILFDLPPSYGFSEKIILSNAQTIIPVVIPEGLSAVSLKTFNEKMKELKLSFKAKYTSIDNLVINQINKRSKVHTEYISALKKTKYKTYEIIMSEGIKNSFDNQTSIQEYLPSSKICEVFSELANNVK